MKYIFLVFTIIFTSCVTVYDIPQKGKSRYKSKTPEVKYVGYLGDGLKTTIVLRDSVYKFITKDAFTNIITRDKGKIRYKDKKEKIILEGVDKKFNLEFKIEGDDIFLLRDDGIPVTKSNGYQYYLTKIGKEIFQEEMINWRQKKITPPNGFRIVRETTKFGKFINSLPNSNRNLSKVYLKNYFKEKFHPLIRLWAEYIWSTKGYEKIYFKNLFGWSMTYTEWCNAYSKKGPSSYTSLIGYLDHIFSKGCEFFEIEAVSIGDVRTGDFFMKDDRVSIVFAVAESKESGNKIVMLGRSNFNKDGFGYINNTQEISRSNEIKPPWFDLSEVGNIKVAGLKFSVNDLRRIVR